MKLNDLSPKLIQYTESMEKHSNIKDLNLSTVVIHKNQIYKRYKWQKQGLWSLQGTLRKVIKVKCKIVNKTKHKKTNQIHVSTSPTNSNQKVCNNPSKLNC